MKRVAALYLPHWPIERLWQAEPALAPRPEARSSTTQVIPPRGHGWRPGARWARETGTGRRPPFAGASRIDALPGKGHGLVTTQRIGAQSLIVAVCPTAHALGADPGMSLTSARALLPQLFARPADPEGDHANLIRLATMLARRWSPSVALDGEDGLLIDLTGVAHLHGGEAAMGRRLVRLLSRAGFSARVAIADCVGAAHALARSWGNHICPPGEQASALAPLPPSLLRLSLEQVEPLRRLGIDTIGQLIAMPRAPLTRRLGESLMLRLDQALGRIAEPIDPIVPHDAIEVKQRFAEPIATPEAIEHWLGQLVPRLTDALASAGLGASRIELVADRIDNIPQRIRIGLARLNRDPAHLLRLLCRRMNDIEPGYGIDAVTLHVRRSGPLGPASIAADIEDVAPDLAPLVDTLATRGAKLWRAKPVESDVPERSTRPTSPLDQIANDATATRIDDVAQLRRLGSIEPWTPLWPRPPRLLNRPEEVDNIIYEVPDHPPRRFRWRGATYRVVRADGPERIAGEWWRRRSETASVRDYFRVEDDRGNRFWLYRRGDGERTVTGDQRWFVHGVFG